MTPTLHLPLLVALAVLVVPSATAAQSDPDEEVVPPPPLEAVPPPPLEAVPPPPEAVPPPPGGVPPVAILPAAVPGPAPQPVSYRVESQPIRGLVNWGAALFALGYAFPLSVAAAFEFDNHSLWLALPVAGPFVVMAKGDYFEGCPIDEDCRDEELGNIFAVMGLITVGALQAGSLIMLTLGLAIRRQVRVPVQEGSVGDLVLAPMLARGTAGLRLGGAF